ncbi:hypothetical protein E0L36_12085 [Streptomyces sp. AJS327]|uniref:hypothetical protein n=1 Tax=Streptomyces sp. AJS327 TaxID=2545265 RepID=UPI0015DE8653|nr:hypothetical protein [Streptomyces sp. AJS327]MBA0051605.1 hypothetical protein [Streptomyces sp. AJS327]
MIDRPSRLVRERPPGASAADALLGALRADIAERAPGSGLTDGLQDFMRCVRSSPPLLARLMLIRHQIVDRLAHTLREETGAAPDDPEPELVASQLANMTDTVTRWGTLTVSAGEDPDHAAATALTRLDILASFATDRLLNYARRPTG